jgi:FtsH-binding integral membrane protein
MLEYSFKNSLKPFKFAFIFLPFSVNLNFEGAISNSPKKIYPHSARAHKMKFSTASIVYVIYSIVTGLTFSSFFVIYELGSIMFIFALTALLFGIFALLGYTTNTDLSKFSTIFLMGLIGIILATIVNVFLNNSMLEIIISWVSIILFLGITAHDIQKIKSLSNVITDENAIAIIGALDLYLDFINIFIDLIKLFGKTRD